MKDKILHKAIEMFLTYGFKTVTMDDISKDLGISKKTIYTHFKNKTELIKETTYFIFEQIEAGIHEICTKNVNAIEELFEIKKLLLNKLKKEQSSPHHQLQKFFPDIYQNLKTRQLKTVNQCIIRNLQKGMDAELYRTNINLEFVSRIYYTGVTGIKDNETFPSNMFSQQQLMEEVLDYHIRAIATDKGLEILKHLTTNQ